MLVFGNVGEVIEPLPEISVHEPVPTAGVLAAIIVLVPQTEIFGPAFATVGTASCCILTVDEEGGQEPLVITHSKTLFPIDKLVTCELGDVGVTTFPEPTKTFQTPEPGEGLFPASVAVFAQTVWFGPAAEIVGIRSF